MPDGLQFSDVMVPQRKRTETGSEAAKSGVRGLSDFALLGDEEVSISIQAVL